jgi:hypothetical protein
MRHSMPKRDVINGECKENWSTATSASHCHNLLSGVGSGQRTMCCDPPTASGDRLDHFQCNFSNHPANVTNEQGMTQLHVDLKAWGSVLLQLHRRLPEAV